MPDGLWFADLELTWLSFSCVRVGRGLRFTIWWPALTRILRFVRAVAFVLALCRWRIRLALPQKLLKPLPGVVLVQIVFIDLVVVWPSGHVTVSRH